MPTTSSLMRSVTREVNPFDNGSLFNGVLILTRETLYIPDSNFTEEVESGIDGRFDVYSLEDILPYLSSTILNSTDVDSAAFENSETYRAIKSIFDYREDNAGITLGNSNVCTIVRMNTTVIPGTPAVEAVYGYGTLSYQFANAYNNPPLGTNWVISLSADRHSGLLEWAYDGTSGHSAWAGSISGLGFTSAVNNDNGVLFDLLGGTAINHGASGGYYYSASYTISGDGQTGEYSVSIHFFDNLDIEVHPTKAEVDGALNGYANDTPYLTWTKTREYTAGQAEIPPTISTDTTSLSSLLLDLSEQSDRKWEFILPAWTMEYAEGLMDGNSDPIKSEVEYFIEACEGLSKGVGIFEFALSAFTNTDNSRKDALRRLTAKYTAHRRSISILTDNTKDYTIAGYFTGWLANQAYGDKYAANIPLGITSSVMAFNLLHSTDMIVNIRDYIGRTQYASEKKVLDDLFDGKNVNFWGSILNSGRAVTGGKLWYGRCNNGGDIRNTIAADMLVNNIEIRYAQEGANGQQLGSSFSDSEQSKNAVRRIVIEEISKVSEYLFIETPMVLVDVIGEKYQISINGIQLGIVTGGNINLTLVKR